jgi:holo-[acyl-carrier protein] synthase
LRIGIDLVDIARLERSMQRSPSIATTIFSSAENELARTLSIARRAEFYAGRFAVKEAAVKALGVGLEFKKMPQLQVLRTRDGAPVLKLSGFWRSAMKKLALCEAHVSISHEGALAVAIVVLNP